MAKPKSTYKPNLLSYVFDPFEDVKIKDPALKDKAANEIADYLKEQVLSFVGDGKSPVAGYGKFKALSSDYKNEKKKIAGNTNPNLELHGDMLDALNVEVDGSLVSLTIEGDQAEKADGHCKLTGRENAALPMRRFIPGAKESFNKSIQSGIDAIVEKYASKDNYSSSDDSENT